jgi:hypothetical protein
MVVAAVGGPAAKAAATDAAIEVAETVAAANVSGAEAGADETETGVNEAETRVDQTETRVDETETTEG